MPDTADLLRHAAERSIDYLDGVAERPVGRPIAADRLRRGARGRTAPGRRARTRSR